MKEIKMIREAIRSLSKKNLISTDDLTESLNDFLAKFNLPLIDPQEVQERIPNKSLPAFDTLDFDDISKMFDD